MFKILCRLCFHCGGGPPYSFSPLAKNLLHLTDTHLVINVMLCSYHKIQYQGLDKFCDMFVPADDRNWQFQLQMEALFSSKSIKDNLFCITFYSLS